MKKLLLMTAITAAIFAVDASASLTELPIIAGSTPPKVDFSTSTGVQNVANVPLPNNLYVAGSSAARGFLERTAEAYAKPGSVIYKYQNASANIFTYVFTAGDTAVLNGLVKDQTYVIHYRTRDGSITAPLISSFPTPDKAVGVTFNSLADFAVKQGEYTCGSASAVTATAPLMVICKSTTSPEKLVVAPANATGAAGKPSVLALSDVDAAQFVSPLNGANAANGLPKKALTMGSTAFAAQVFGIGVNLKLRNAMQAAQLDSGSLPSTCTVGDDTEACMPGFTSAQITSIFASGRFNDWTNLSYGKGNLVSANPGKTPKNTAVHICSRTAGSGTLATFQTVFENAPCSVNEAIQAAVSKTIFPLQSSVLGEEKPNATAKVYHSIESSGDVENCLASLDGYDVLNKKASTTGIVGNGNFGAGTTTPLVLNPATSGEDFRWAVGIFNADRNATNVLPYRFIKIDGYSPSLINTANGKYKFWSELSYITPTPTTKLSLTAQAFVNGMSKPEIIAKSNLKTASWDKTAASASGYMATAARAISGATAFNPALPVMPFTHSNGAASVGSVNHCRAPAILSGNKLLPGLN